MLIVIIFMIVVITMIKMKIKMICGDGDRLKRKVLKNVHLNCLKMMDDIIIIFSSYEIIFFET